MNIMRKKQSVTEKQIIEHLHTSGAGYDILRHICLPDLLGKDSFSILYVMGKNLARKMELETTEEIINFFIKSGWGNLVLSKEKRREILFELTGDALSQRLDTGVGNEYRLEAGFLAESLQQIRDVPCECLEEIIPKNSQVIFSAMYTK